MNKKLMTALTAPALIAALTLGSLASASTVTYDVGVDGSSVSSPLIVGNSTQTIRLPLSSLGGTLPGDLSISASNLPDGVTLSLNSAAVDGDSVVLSVSTQDSNDASFSAGVDALANVSVIAGGKTLTLFQVPVQTAVIDTTPRFQNAFFDN
ncbi:hypothetical protein [Deinococcus aquiradiocola]|uniref:Uncharacterized protein n=1 Tax=Deinococcus aquiradiocola TaxID=393059 RepID=A0A917UVP9_9DEIO|nr:hypothetical protein [Deinococcus aquiradiocola]GGJ88700.1 hypothetical protein GCM10008939_35990 [Deinococcus aquiradiocola]